MFPDLRVWRATLKPAVRKKRQFETVHSLALLAFAAVLILPAIPAVAEDWPAYRHDNRRSGVTGELLNPAALKAAWTYQAPFPPEQAWHGPAKWDAYAEHNNLRSMRNYDPAYFTIAVGDAVYFGSSAEDAVFCLDAATGAVRWCFVSGGPVRMAPSYAGGVLYFGSDDGVAYALDAATGKIVWKYRPGEARLVPSDGKFISRWPIRTGVLVDSGKAYFGAALLPWTTSYLCAVDTSTGKDEGAGLFRKTIEGVTLEGALLASPDRLYVPQGRTRPLVFSRSDGSDLGVVENAGGVFALLTAEHEIAFTAPKQKEDYIALQGADKLATFKDAWCLVVSGDTAYVLRDADLTAVQRKTGDNLWTVPCDCPYTLILAGDVLFAGGRDKVIAFSTKDGARLAELAVKGRAHGLTAANGCLLVSTDTGEIHVFR